MIKTVRTFAALGAIAALLLVGCGSDGDSSGAYGSKDSTKASSTASPAPGQAAAVSVAKVAELGRILVDSRGFTLYDFHKDRGGASTCYGACADTWPPLVTNGAPQGEDGALASMLGTTGRRDGTTQVTYAGHPLYTYEIDTRPGDAKGNDVDSFGAEWYALQPSGEDAEG